MGKRDPDLIDPSRSDPDYTSRSDPDDHSRSDPD